MVLFKKFFAFFASFAVDKRRADVGSRRAGKADINLKILRVLRDLHGEKRLLVLIEKYNEE